jgi:hypothetical protein
MVSFKSNALLVSARPFSHCMTIVAKLEPEGASKSPNLADATGKWVRFACVFALLLAIGFSTFVRLRWRNMPLERDEGEFAYAGQLMLQGIPPYKLASNMKLPGTYAAYAAIMAVFGETSGGIRTGLIFANIATTILVFFLGKYLYGWLAGTVAGMTYSFLSCRPAVLGFYAHATHFVVLAALAGVLLLMYAIKTQRSALYFGGGFCLGMAFLMKQPGIFFTVFAGCYWLWREWKRPAGWRAFALRGSALFAGIALPFGVTCLLLYRAGVFSNFWFWTWSYAREYGSIATWPDARNALRAFLPWVVRPFVIWEVIALGLIAPLWSRYAREHWGFVTSFFLFSCLAICPGFYFRPHYFILVLPAAALCAGIAVSAAQRGLQKKQSASLIAWFPVIYFAFAFAISARGEYRKYFRFDPNLVVQKIQPGEAFPEAAMVGAYLEAHSSVGETIGVLGSEPEICFYSERPCASSYVYLYPLLEKQKFAGQMQNEMMRQIQESHPAFLVFVDDMRSWGSEAQLAENRAFVEWAWAYTQRGYELVNQVPIAGLAEPVKGGRARLYVFRRAGPQVASAPFARLGGQR